MTVTELIAALWAVVIESGEPDAEVWFDRNDEDNVVAMPHSDGDTWPVQGIECVGGRPFFDDYAIFLHA